MHPFFTTREAIEAWFQGRHIAHYEILASPPGSESPWTVNVDDDVILFYEKIPALPINFGEVRGNFFIQFCDLLSLRGVPQIVGKYFSCANNQLTSLEYGPTHVEGDYRCYHNLLTSIGDPAQNLVSLGGNFNATDNPLQSIGRLPLRRDKIIQFGFQAQSLNIPGFEAWHNQPGVIQLKGETFNTLIEKRKLEQQTQVNPDMSQKTIIKI